MMLSQVRSLLIASLCCVGIFATMGTIVGVTATDAYAQTAGADSVVDDRTAQAAKSFESELLRRQMQSFLIGLAALITAALLAAWVTRPWWINLPTLHWILLIAAPAIATAVGSRALVKGLHTLLDGMTQQSLSRVATSARFYADPDVTNAVRVVQDMKVFAGEGLAVLWWHVAGPAVLGSLVAGVAACVGLWFFTNFLVLRGRFTGPGAGF